MRQLLLAASRILILAPGAALAASSGASGSLEYLLLSFLLGIAVGGLGLHWLKRPRIEEESEGSPSMPSAVPPLAAAPPQPPAPAAQAERRATPRTDLSASLANPASASSVARPRVSGMEVIEHHQLNDQGSTDLYQTVAGVLLRSLELNPTRNDLRYKLLEVLFQASKAEEFERHAIDYQRNIRSAADSRWAELCEMAHGLGISNELFGAMPTAGTDAAAAVASAHAQRYYDGVDAERLRQATERLSSQYEKLTSGGALFRDYTALLCCHLPRPTPMQWGERIGQIFGQTTLVLKREELRVPFEAELMNAIGQVLVAAELKKKRVITGTRSGASGIAAARAASMFGLDCRIYVSAGGAVSDSTLRHIRSFGAEVVQVMPSGAEEVADSRRRALIDWLIEPEHSLFVSGLQGGPRAQQKMMLDFSGVVGRECLEQCRAMGIGDLRAIYASTAGGSATLGFLAPLLQRPQLRRVVAHEGDLDKVLFRREHAWLRDSGQVEYETIELETALEAQMALARVEGISISLDDARALAIALRHAVAATERSTSILLLSPAKLMVPPPDDEARTIRISGKSPAAPRDRPISGADFG